MPFHLLLPFFASLVLGIGALFTKHAKNNGVSVWTLTLAGNLFTSVLFSGLWFFGGEIPSLDLIWQPAIVGLLYVIGQTLILSAISFGDVSVALPVASLKVVFVTLLLTLTSATVPGLPIWIAAMFAVAGVFLINYVAPQSERRQILVTLAIAMSGAATFALFDICLQAWSDNGESTGENLWPMGRMLPMAFWFVGLISLVYYPFSDRISTIKPKARNSVAWAAILVGAQALFMCLALSLFGDAARVNVVYSLRGLWAVLLAWMFASQFGGNESVLPRRTMVSRFIGALLLILAVVIAIIAE